MQLQKLLLVFGLALLGISLSEAIPGGRGGGQDDKEKTIEKRARTSMNIQRLKNDLKLLLECQALNKEDRSLTDGPCVSFIFGIKNSIIIGQNLFFYSLKLKNEKFCQLKMLVN